MSLEVHRDEAGPGAGGPVRPPDGDRSGSNSFSGDIGISVAAGIMLIELVEDDPLRSRMALILICDKLHAELHFSAIQLQVGVDITL